MPLNKFIDGFYGTYMYNCIKFIFVLSKLSSALFFHPESWVNNSGFNYEHGSTHSEYKRYYVFSPYWCLGLESQKFELLYKGLKLREILWRIEAIEGTTVKNWEYGFRLSGVRGRSRWSDSDGMSAFRLSQELNKSGRHKLFQTILVNGRKHCSASLFLRMESKSGRILFVE